MSTDEFNLLSSPWVRVREGSQVVEVSLIDAFAQAHRLTALAGEVPSQDAAMLRLMLAILDRAVDGPGYPPQRWADLWRAETLPMDLIGNYLTKNASRFNLFDDSMPFMQVADLRASKTSGLVKLIADVPDGEEFFSMRSGSEVSTMSPAEAARWLVHVQAFDVSGIKTGAIGDLRVKGGKGYPIGTGWSGRGGLVILEGESLRETLLLNLVLKARSYDDDPDLPVWERPPLGAGVESSHPEPMGPADLFTWPSRRLLLTRDADTVVDVLLTNGDPIHPRNRHEIETMVAFRRSPNQEKVHGGTVYMPRTHDPERKLWRGLSEILVQRPASSAGNEAVSDLAPQNIAWLETLIGEGQIPRDYPVKFHGVGVSYGTQDSSIEAMSDSVLTMVAGVTSEDRLRGAVLDAAAVADLSVRALGDLGSNLAIAAGRNPDGSRAAAREDAFARLERPYAAWVAHITSQTDLDLAEALWQKRVRGLVDQIANELVEAAGEDAWVGREVKGRRYDSSLAWRWFQSALRKALPRSYEEVEAELKPDLAGSGEAITKEEE